MAQQQLTPRIIHSVDVDITLQSYAVGTNLADGVVIASHPQVLVPTGRTLSSAANGVEGTITQTILGEYSVTHASAQVITPIGVSSPKIMVNGDIISMIPVDGGRSKEIELDIFVPMLTYARPSKSGLAGVMLGGASGGNGVGADGWLPPRRTPFGYTPRRR